MENMIGEKIKDRKLRKNGKKRNEEEKKRKGIERKRKIMIIEVWMMMISIRDDRGKWENDKDGGWDNSEKRMKDREELRDEKKESWREDEEKKDKEGVKGRNDWKENIFIEWERIGVNGKINRRNG